MREKGNQTQRGKTESQQWQDTDWKFSDGDHGERRGGRTEEDHQRQVDVAAQIGPVRAHRSLTASFLPVAWLPVRSMSRQEESASLRQPAWVPPPRYP